MQGVSLNCTSKTLKLYFGSCKLRHDLTLWLDFCHVLEAYRLTLTLGLGYSEQPFLG